MRTSSSASETPRATGRPISRRVALLAGWLLIGCRGGCGQGGPGAGSDSPSAVHDAARDSQAVTSDADDRRDGGAVLDAGALVPDGSAASLLCPQWRSPAAAGRGWLYTHVRSSDGVPLTSSVNHVDIYVRRASDPLPGERASANDPCAVASYEQTASRVLILAAAVGFSSQEREFPPQTCLETSPCTVELPRSLDGRFYQASLGTVSLRPASDVAQNDKVEFAAAVAGDALARSKALQKPLSDELDKAGKATDVPAVDLAIHYTEAKLKKKCDARCLDDTSLDPAVRKYLKTVQTPARPNPFALRRSPDRWRHER